MKEIIDRVKGYKTYILSGLGLGILGAYLLDFLDLESTVMILASLGFGSAMTLRASISDLRSKLDDLK